VLHSTSAAILGHSVWSGASARQYAYRYTCWPLLEPDVEDRLGALVRKSRSLDATLLLLLIPGHLFRA
jgi:hypothetical protein